MRLHEHSANLQPASVALTPIFLRLCSDNEDLAIRKGITLRVQRTRAAVMSDAILLEGILRNLVRNALNMLAPADGFWLAAVAWC